MRKYLLTLMRGVSHLGMAQELVTIYQTTPPAELPPVLTAEEALAQDADALSGDWERVWQDLQFGYEKGKVEIDA